MKEPARSTKYTSKLTQWHPPVTVTLILWYKPMLCWSLSRKALPRKPVASADAHTTTGNAQLMVLHATSVATRITRLSNVEAPGGGTVQPVAHPPQEGHRIDRDGSAPSRKAKDMEAVASRNLLPTRSQGKAVATGVANSPRQVPWQLLIFPDHNTLPKLMVWKELRQRRL